MFRLILKRAGRCQQWPHIALRGTDLHIYSTQTTDKQDLIWGLIIIPPADISSVLWSLSYYKSLPLFLFHLSSSPSPSSCSYPLFPSYFLKFNYLIIAYGIVLMLYEKSHCLFPSKLINLTAPFRPNLSPYPGENIWSL